MWLCSPITWPMGKLLDYVLGHEDVVMQRRQLKAMVQLHAEDAGEGQGRGSAGVPLGAAAFGSAAARPGRPAARDASLATCAGRHAGALQPPCRTLAQRGASAVTYACTLF